MITRIEALNFRCLKDIDVPLGAFHVLAGPNASGKSTFLEVVALIGRLVSSGLEAAVLDRTQNFQDWVWKGTGTCFELAIEAKIPAERKGQIKNVKLDTIRYEIAIGIDSHTEEVSILGEKALLMESTTSASTQRTLFPMEKATRSTLLTRKGQKDTKTMVSKSRAGNASFSPEVQGKGGKPWTTSFKLGPHISALGALPPDEKKFPVATWFKKLLTEGVQQFVLNSELIRKASPPGRVKGFKADGSNLPWVIQSLRKKPPTNFDDWIEHLQTALPDLEDIRTIEREDDKHRYLKLRYRGDIEVPSWMASDGTLRLLALTLPAYLKDFEGIFLIEEPENGIHPQAVAAIIQSLTSVYNAQVLLATHSPVILSMVEPAQVLCFAKTDDGATDIVLGSEHPALKDWRGEVNLGVLFAAGVLG